MKVYEFERRKETEDNIFELRETLRGHKWKKMPNTRGCGFVVEDLDLILRWYGPPFKLDSEGRFRLVEIKHSLYPNLDRDLGKIYTFKPIVETLQSYNRFDGYFVVGCSDMQHTATTSYSVNGMRQEIMSAERFMNWCLNPWSEIPGMWTRPDPLPQPRLFVDSPA